MTKERVAALLVLTDSTFLGQQRRLTDLAGRSNLPALYSQKEFVVNGGLASYGPSLRDMYDNVAADTCRQDPEEAKPGDIPIEQPTKFELGINLKTARRWESPFQRTCCCARMR